MFDSSGLRLSNTVMFDQNPDDTRLFPQDADSVQLKNTYVQCTRMWVNSGGWGVSVTCSSGSIAFTNSNNDPHSV